MTVYTAGGYPAGGREPSSLGDLLERVLDKGLVIAGDIRVSLLDIELLTIKLRLVVASVETARELGIDWWENDPWLSSSDTAQRKLLAENSQLRARLAAAEGGGQPRGIAEPAGIDGAAGIDGGLTGTDGRAGRDDG